MSRAVQRLENLWSAGKAFLGVDVAILGGAMSWVSERNLVSAISVAGGFGVIACGSMSPEMLQAEIIATRSMTNKPFGVNLIILHPDLSELVDVCVAQKVSHLVMAGGIPSSAIIASAKREGAKVICFAPTAAIGKKLVRNGADALVIEGSEAGGHIGPVSTSVLAQEILPVIRDVPVFVAGGIGRGEAIVSYLEMGAAGVQLGTRFVCASESIAHPDFKKAFIKANARDAVASIQVDPDFPVIPVRALENTASKKFVTFQQEMIDKVRLGQCEQKEALLAIEHYWAGALRRAVIDGDVENGSLMAGQSVGMVNKVQPVQEIIDEIVAQTIACLESRD